MNDENYIKAIRSNLSGPKVFLKRKPSEVRVNGYMKTVLIAWQANHDLQFVLDAFACAVYIVSYISKSQKGMSALLDQAAKEARQGNLDLKHQTIRKKAKQYEGKVIDLEKAIEEAENDCNENDQIAPATQQVEMEDAEIGPTESEQYVHFNPDRPTEHRLYDMSREVGIEARTVELTNHANRISESDYFDLIRSLNKKQWEFFKHVVTWVKTKHEPFYTFLTGGAGCGKSVVVRTIFQALHRHLCSIEGEDPDDIRILLCAPTGKAAYNINGLTIHNAFQIQPNKGLDQSLSCDVLNTLRMKYRNLSLILIDEISMVGNKMFSLLERRLKKIKGSNCSFGGVSIIAIGDFFQLQPVFDSWIFNDLSKGLTALAPNYWKLLFSFHELTEIMRQKDDLEFAQLLNRLRQNQLTENDFAVLNTRTVSISDPTYRTNATHLFVENALVDNFNLQYISKLGSQKVKVKAVDTVCGDLPASVKTKLLSSLPEKQSDTANLAKEVVLAIGMKYDLTANIEVTDGLTNGSTCELKLIECKTKSIDQVSYGLSLRMPELVLTIEENIHTCMEKMLKKHGLQCLTLKGHLLINIRPLKEFSFLFVQQPEKQFINRKEIHITRSCC
ncbi:Hypothetical predicted protein [Mytilus galloprovincialis]|uniref:ATP-dependent DNA helicase n=1 Tax=Mytilus galloprovincialis TaxID=29158 RepID=A0A8B6DU83_MYTGA|nr:Hypothetical predicted protein [Mytilus galloprovincialis]